MLYIHDIYGFVNTENKVQQINKAYNNDFSFSKVMNDTCKTKNMSCGNNDLILLYEKMKRNISLKLDPNYNVWI